MRGHQALSRMRRSGEKPSVVFIDTDAGPSALPSWTQWQNINETLCDIDIEPGESLLRLDFRPLIGLVVHVSGTNSPRVRAVAELVKQAGAKRVISSCTRQVGQGEWIAFDTVWVHDTDGFFDQEPTEEAA